MHEFIEKMKRAKSALSVGTRQRRRRIADDIQSEVKSYTPIELEGVSTEVLNAVPATETTELVEEATTVTATPVHDHNGDISDCESLQLSTNCGTAATSVDSDTDFLTTAFAGTSEEEIPPGTNI